MGKIKPAVIWLTGLSGSGKSTLANLLHQELETAGVAAGVLDGDKLRKGLNSDLDFSLQSRKENVRRTVEVCKLMMDAGLVVITALISPLQEDRELAKLALGTDSFMLVHINCPLTVCEQRDPKKLYLKVRKGEIKNFTGIDSPYEVPTEPDVVLNTDMETADDCIKKLRAVVFLKLNL